jgi:hypothetical protein
MLLFHPNSDKNRFGYYEVGDYRTYSKYDAITTSENTGKKIHWNFNDEAFSCYDWTVEPSDSLPELYRRRAQQIRDKYDYIVLCLSGGADSHNALMSFIKNGIHLDEILTYHCREGDKGDETTFQNAEPFKVAIPFGKMLTDKFPQIKQRIVDMTDMMLRFWRDRPEAKFDFIYYGNACTSAHTFTRGDLKYYVEDYRKMIESGKKLCLIHATDKPSVVYENNQWHARFYDNVDHSVPPNLQMYNRENEHDEFFYWSPDLPELIIKQCHLLKKYFSIPENTEKIKNFPRFNQWGHEFSLGQSYYKGLRLTNEIIKSVIYPYWTFDTYSNEKSPSGLMFTLRDNWFYGSGTEQSKYFAMGAAKMTQLDKKWFTWRYITDDYSLNEHLKIFKTLVYPNHQQFKKLIGKSMRVMAFPHMYKSIYSHSYHLDPINHANSLTSSYR